MIVLRRVFFAMLALAICVISPGCSNETSGTAVSPPVGKSVQQFVRSGDIEPPHMKWAATIVYTPSGGPLDNPAFDAQASAAGLDDVSQTYATNQQNVIDNTGKQMLGSLQTHDIFMNTSVALRFVAGSSGAPYINTRMTNGKAIGMFWSGGSAQVFDSFSGWTFLGGLSTNLVSGNTYFAKLDVAQTSPTTTVVTASFLNPDASVVATQKFTDTISAAQRVLGADDVEESKDGLAASEVLVSRGVAPNSFVLGGSMPSPSPSPSPSVSASPTAKPSATPTATPTAKATATPIPSPTPTSSGGVPVSLCIGQPKGPGLVYNLASHDEFDKDAALNTGAPIAGDLNVSDSYGPAFLASNKQTTWSTTYSFGRENGGLDGTDDSGYPSLADIATWQKEYGASKYPSVIQLKPGVGVQLLAYAAPQPVPSDVQALLCADGTCRHNLGGLMDGNVNNAYEYGYWVYSVEVPDGRSSAPGFWPSDWTLCETVCSAGNNNYYEMDTFEVFSTILGQGTFDQTLQPENPGQSSGQSMGPGPITGEQLDRITNSTIQTQFHQYAELSSPTYVGFWFDNVAESGALNQVPAAQNPNNPGVSPIMVMQTCTYTSFCAPGVSQGEAPGVMTEQYYRHYAPSTTTCGPPYDVPAQPAQGSYLKPPTAGETM